MQEAQLSTPSVGLYFDLRKRSLTNTLHAVEPDADDAEHRYVLDFIRHYVNGQAISMLPVVRLDSLQACILDVLLKGILGDLIETGVWRGGAVIFMQAVLKVAGACDRTVWVADSFEGLPLPDAEKYPVEAKAHHGSIMQTSYKHFAEGLDTVQANFRAYGMLDSNVRFLKGWFKDTLPTAPIGPLAIMRLDGDYYESTMDALTNLYDKLSIGGYAIIDDYGEDTWTCCRKAVDDFRSERGIAEPMIRVDSKCFYWQRAS